MEMEVKLCPSENELEERSNMERKKMGSPNLAKLGFCSCSFNGADNTFTSLELPESGWAGYLVFVDAWKLCVYLDCACASVCTGGSTLVCCCLRFSAVFAAAFFVQPILPRFFT